MKIKVIGNALLALMIITGPGCATMSSRHELWPWESRVYPAIRADGKAFWVFASGQAGMTLTPSPWGRLACRTIVPLCYLVDMPVSLVTDTLMLPVDVYQTDWQQVRDREHQQNLTLEDRRRIRDDNLRQQEESNQAFEAIGDPGSPQPQR